MKTATQSPVLITPTVGRVVWFYPDPRSGDSGFAPPPKGEPLAAIIAHVHGPKMVNLTVFDANGNAHSRTSVFLVEDEELHKRLGDYSYCTWMPFQKGQAKAQDAAASAPTNVSADHGRALEAAARNAAAAHALYAAIKQAMELIGLHPRTIDELRDDTEKAYDVLFRAFWSETPIPASVTYRPHDWVEPQNAAGMVAVLGQLADDGRYGVSRVPPRADECRFGNAVGTGDPA